jgi:ribosomal protein S18 acetylase RimI-like enzyme
MILKEKGMISVELLTDSDNIAARSLYEKKGFTLVDEKDKRVKYIYYL